MTAKIKSVFDANQAQLILSHDKDDDLIFVHAKDDRQEVICIALNEESARAVMDALQEYVDDCVQKSYEKAKLAFPYKEGDRLLMSDDSIVNVIDVISDYWDVEDGEICAALVPVYFEDGNTRSYWYGADGYPPEYRHYPSRWGHLPHIVRKLEDGE